MTGTVAIRSPPESPQSSVADDPMKPTAEQSPQSSADGEEGAAVIAPGGYLDTYVDPRTLLILPDGGSGNEYTVYFHDATKAAADSKKMRKLGAQKEDYEAAFDRVSS